MIPIIDKLHNLGWYSVPNTRDDIFNETWHNGERCVYICGLTRYQYTYDKDDISLTHEEESLFRLYVMHMNGEPEVLYQYDLEIDFEPENDGEHICQCETLDTLTKAIAVAYRYMNENKTDTVTIHRKEVKLAD